MFKVLFVYLSLMSLVFGGGLPEVTHLSEENVIKDSHTVFEAIFVEEEISYLLDGKISTKEAVWGAYHEDLKDDNSSSTLIRRKITLLVSRSIKGELKKHQIRLVLAL